MIIAIIFWGCIGVAIALSAVGLVSRSPVLLILAAVFTLPLALYCAATPRFGFWGLLIPIPQIISALVVRRILWLAIICGSFFGMFVAWLEVLLLGSIKNAVA